MANPELVFKSGRELAGLIKTRKVSPLEVTQAFLARIETLNPRVNAYITVTGEQALAAARVAEKEITAGRNAAVRYTGFPTRRRTFSRPRASRPPTAPRLQPMWSPITNPRSRAA